MKCLTIQKLKSRNKQKKTQTQCAAYSFVFCFEFLFWFCSCLRPPALSLVYYPTVFTCAVSRLELAWLTSALLFLFLLPKSHHVFILLILKTPQQIAFNSAAQTNLTSSSHIPQSLLQHSFHCFSISDTFSGVTGWRCTEFWSAMIHTPGSHWRTALETWWAEHVPNSYYYY